MASWMRRSAPLARASAAGVGPAIGYSTSLRNATVLPSTLMRSPSTVIPPCGSSAAVTSKPSTGRDEPGCTVSMATPAARFSSP